MNLNSQFSGLKPKDLRVYPVQAVWVGTVSAGQFIFSSTVQILPVMFNSYYQVVEIDIGASIDEITFTNAIDTNYNPNGFSFNFGSQYLGNTVFSLTPFCFSIFRRNCPVSYGYKTGQQKTAGTITTTDSIQSTISGALNQTAEIISLGVSEISIYAYFTILQVTNPDWIKENVGNG